MNLHSELLRQARHLATKEPRRPLQASLRRAFDHGTMRRVAQQFAASSVAPRLRPGLQGEPLQPELELVAATFVDLQHARHEADYNTAWRSTRPDALGLIEQTEDAFACWRSVRRTPQADTFLIGLLIYDKLRG